ncbi:hypothetical protein C8R44DRAFT_880543 [Mycena epipterygia]|nr:hypothetical protein C8R44DRAFT_880543 [Mycena epipterygia]
MSSWVIGAPSPGDRFPGEGSQQPTCGLCGNACLLPPPQCAPPEAALEEEPCFSYRAPPEAALEEEPCFSYREAHQNHAVSLRAFSLLLKARLSRLRLRRSLAPATVRPTETTPYYNGAHREGFTRLKLGEVSAANVLRMPERIVATTPRRDFLFKKLRRRSPCYIAWPATRHWRE